MRLVVALDGNLINLDNKDIKRCSICLAWFWRALLRSGTYCSACNNDYQAFRLRRKEFDRRNLGNTWTDVSVPRFRELYMSGILAHDGDNLRPWVDRWHPGQNDHVIPSGAIAITDD
jgi:hypothetical protein